jgi:phosphoribosylformylglycinamidine cyclo-ligase
MSNRNKRGLSYRDAGVDIERGEQLIECIKPAAAATRRPGVMGTLGGFGGLFDLHAAGYRDPVLVSSTDGVGTKLLLAIETDHHETIGFDLVAMCVNDVVAQGAEPLLFLDYFATGALSVDKAAAVVNSIAEACGSCGAALLGGETAEMPGMYPPGHYDLAGFCVGAVERGDLIDGKAVVKDDVILGLASDGVHANGYSLVRAILKTANLNLDEAIDGTTLGKHLLRPTRIYVKSVLAAAKQGAIHAIAHITGGGLTQNVPRVLPPHLSARIELDRWRLPPIFARLADAGGIAEDDMLKTFNCGIGMALVVPPIEVEMLTRALTQAGETVIEIGKVVEGAPGVRFAGRLA